MAARPVSIRLTALLLLACLGLSTVRSDAQRGANRPAGAATVDFERALQQQAETDRKWRTASQGVMRMEKILYRSRVGDLDVPAFVFQPLEPAEPRTKPAIVWVHENVRGHLYEHFIPYVREAVSLGYVIIAPEYRGSVGYGKAFYDAIDYGGAEVADVVQAAAVLELRYPAVNPNRIGIIGWSHGGMIALLAAARSPNTFQAAAALVPVTNLFHRLARKGVEAQRRAIDPHNRFGGSPEDVPAVYRERSPLFQIDRIRIPLLVHVADNDEDVEIDESMPLIDALRARKGAMATVKVYHSPLGGHTFDRRMIPGTFQPENNAAQRDSWQRVWTFLDNYLQSSYN